MKTRTTNTPAYINSRESLAAGSPPSQTGLMGLFPSWARCLCVVSRRGEPVSLPGRHLWKTTPRLLAAKIPPPSTLITHRYIPKPSIWRMAIEGFTSIFLSKQALYIFTQCVKSCWVRLIVYICLCIDPWFVVTVCSRVALWDREWVSWRFSVPVLPFKSLKFHHSIPTQHHPFPCLTPENAPAFLIEGHHGTFVSSCGHKRTINENEGTVRAFLKVTDRENSRCLCFIGVESPSILQIRSLMRQD